MIRRSLLQVVAFVCVSAIASPAFAQGSYIGAFLLGDIVRLDQYESLASDSGSGEALGFGLRLGTPISGRWGVELEFVRPGEITSEQSPQILPALTDVPFPVSLTPERVGPGVYNVDVVNSLEFPSYSYTYRATERRTTISTALWIRQEISPRFSLAYVGGIAFGRTEREVEVTYLPIRALLPIAPRTTIAPTVSEFIDYNVGPMVGVEGRIRMAGQVDLVPGLRLHGIDSGWMIRPAVGLSWTF